ncbi:hypothetical protein [Streptomyces lydicus]|uniref:hypothetical protein n=1 Tax=Streptomyces lydicus TaxID=47763 RepID=UPI0036EC83A6
MDSTALIIASIGVFGTLASGLLAQRSALQLKQLELESTERQRVTELDSAAREAARTTLRTCFVNLNYSLRTYYGELQNHLRTLQHGSTPRKVSASLEGSRQAVRSALAEAQLIAPTAILEAAKECGALLGDSYRTLTTIEGETDHREELILEAQTLLEVISGKLARMRDEMRDELGVEPPGDR